MKRILASLFCTAIMFSSPVWADLVVPGENNPVLSENSLLLNNAKFNVVKRIDKGTVTLKVFNSDGKEFWSSNALGEQEKLFTIDGAAAPLACKDLTGDGVPEIVTAAMTGPDSSALYVFKYDGESKSFTAMNFKYEKENLTRDFLVSDMYQKDGQDLVLLPENKIRALGKIYAEDAAPVPGFYTFSLNESQFLCSEISPVPTDAPADDSTTPAAADEMPSTDSTPAPADNAADAPTQN
ncbi:MAG TPA: hypothetical protein PLM07_20860 [Candidatus Rifleibacterium sp.]|nr:hypothetical protein [Candidatus Rifleibacterium sp.]HPT48342.1 hypothetical protein [Candidatus Rifleibacterium sp.]